MRPSSLAALAALTVACGGNDEVTFAEVATVLDARCMQCHQAGGIAPQTFDSYEATKPWADMIAAVTAERTMPPKQVTADGSCGDYVDDWWLSDDELQVLADWAQAGAPEGKPVTRTSPKPLPTLEPTVTVTTPSFAPEPLGTPEALNDEYRCFPIDIGVTEDMFLTGFDTTPGNPAVVHHVIGNFVDPDATAWNSAKTNRQLMDELDAASPDRLGWPCFSGAGDNGREYVNYENDALVWAPGQGAVEFPEGTGVSVPAGSILVAQMHFNMDDPDTIGQSDTTTIEMRLEPEVEKEAYVLYLETMIADPFTGRPVVLPKGKDSVERSFSVEVQDLVGVPIPLNIIGVVPHMHERGVTLTDTITRAADDTEFCLTEVTDWDYNWQFIYFYEEPVRVLPSDIWTMTCTYDTSDATEDVVGGWGTQNEMCLTVVYATL